MNRTVKSTRPGSMNPEMMLMPWILVGSILLILTFAGVRYAFKAYSQNVGLYGKKEIFIHIPTGANFKTVMDSLESRHCLLSKGNFEWLAKRKQYPSHILPGRYRLTNGMSNFALVNLFKSGRQEPLRITIQNVRTPAELAAKLSRRLEPDSIGLINKFTDPVFLSHYGVSPATLFVLFIPNTYEFYWNTSVEALLGRMLREHNRFWNEKRKQQAGFLGLSVPDVVTLASIVEKESNKDDEKPVIAGVYLNRLNKKMLLQADPTVIFAWQDFTIRRVLGRHTAIKSPYNTYQNPGLPPGPICMPSIASIEAVLNPGKHQYLYFCAKEDLSGYHNFANTLDEHQRNAKKYQTALNRLKIR